MIYVETIILGIFMLLAIYIFGITLYRYIQDKKTYNEWKKRQEFAKLFCECYETITGEKIKITVMLDTYTYEFEYNKEADE